MCLHNVVKYIFIKSSHFLPTPRAPLTTQSNALMVLIKFLQILKLPCITISHMSKTWLVDDILLIGTLSNARAISKIINMNMIISYLHSKKKSTSEHLFWCFRLSQIEDSIEYQMDPKIPIMVLPGTIWSFQVLNRVLYL